MAERAVSPDEWWPVYVLSAPEDSWGHIIDVPDELIERHEKALAEHESIQEELYKLLRENGVFK